MEVSLGGRQLKENGRLLVWDFLGRRIWYGEVIPFLKRIGTRRFAKRMEEKAGGGNLEKGIEMGEIGMIHIGKHDLFLYTVNRSFWLVGSNKVHAVL